MISNVSELNIVCVLDENNSIKEVYENAVKKAMESVNVVEHKTQCMFYKGTLRSGQVFEADGSVVILGDVNPWGKVIAKGSVIVLGSLKGNIFAGVDGNENAFVVALEMNPMQIKIGDIIARSSDTGAKISKGKNKVKVIEPAELIEDIKKELSAMNKAYESWNPSDKGNSYNNSIFL